MSDHQAKGVRDLINKRQQREWQRSDGETIIAKGVVIEGHVKSSGILRVDGTIEGEVHTTGDLVVGEGGHVKARVSATNLVIAGQVHGDVEISGKLHILPGGALHGNATIGLLVVEEGAVFKGECAMEVKRGDEPPLSIVQKLEE